MTKNFRIRTADGQLVEIPAQGSDLYRISVTAGDLHMDQFVLTPEDLLALEDRLHIGNSITRQASTFGNQFLEDMKFLEAEHPILFYGSILLAAGVLVVLFVPAMSGFTLFSVGSLTITAGLAAKGSLMGLGGYMIGRSVNNIFELNDLRPSTPLGKFYVEKEIIVEKGTALMAGIGLVILSAETLHMLNAAKVASAATVQSTPLRSILIGCATYCHPDELALIFANAEGTAHILAEEEPYVCQHDQALNMMVCLNEDQIPIDTRFALPSHGPRPISISSSPQ